MLTWYKHRKYREKVVATVDLLLAGFPRLSKSSFREQKRETREVMRKAFEEERNPYEVGLGIATGFVIYLVSNHMTALQKSECLTAWENKSDVIFTTAIRNMISVAYGLVTTFNLEPLFIDTMVNEIMDTLREIPSDQRRLNRLSEYLLYTDPENIRRSKEFLQNLK